MNIICSDFDKIASRVKSEKRRIIMFGAGVLGQITIPNILKEYGLLDFIDYYIDNDPNKWNCTIRICDKKYVVKPPNSVNDTNSIMFINVSRYSEVIEQLESMEATKNMNCYLSPMLCIHNFCMNESDDVGPRNTYSIIPKRINYMWLGRKQMPDSLKLCIETWYKFCADYEIIEWNEDNYDINKHPYMVEAYEHGAYGFVPDYARIDILYNYGGVYLDTDVELLRNIDPLLKQEAFCGVEKWQTVNLGGCSGAIKGHPMIKKFLEARKDIHFVDTNGNQNKNTCGFYDTNVVLNEGYVLNGTTQNICGMNIYAYDYFHPYDYMSGMTNITKNTYSVHRFSGGWMDEKMKQQNLKSQEQYIELYNKCIR